MTSAWGKAWGVSWGNSWGSTGQEPEPPPEEPKSAGGGRGPVITGRQRRLLKQIKEEDEIVMAFLASFLQVVDL